MRFYEIPFSVATDVVPQAVSSILSKISSVVSASGGQIVKSEYWGIRDFAYKVDGRSNGRYYLIIVKCGSNIKDLEPYFAISDVVLRHGIFLVEEVNLNASPLAREKSAGTSPEEAEFYDVLAS